MAMHINNESISNMSNNHNVNHPPHYNQGVIECIDAIRAATTGLDPYEAFLAASAIKYIQPCGRYRKSHLVFKQDY